jgi:hypothetical protein
MTEAVKALVDAAKNILKSNEARYVGYEIARGIDGLVPAIAAVEAEDAKKETFGMDADKELREAAGQAIRVAEHANKMRPHLACKEIARVLRVVLSAVDGRPTAREALGAVKDGVVEIVGSLRFACDNYQIHGDVMAELEKRILRRIDAHLQQLEGKK